MFGCAALRSSAEISSHPSEAILEFIAALYPIVVGLDHLSANNAQGLLRIVSVWPLEARLDMVRRSSQNKAFIS